MSVYFLLMLALMAGVGLGFAGGSMIERRVSAAIHQNEMQRLVNLMTIGVVEPSSRKYEPRPTAESRAISAIKADRIANAAAVIQERYREKGLILGDEEARLQAEAMLAGRSPVERVG